MRIAIYWEQNAWGGVDTHLLALLRSWPSDKDSFIIYYNKGNQGLKRIKSDIEGLDNVTLKEVVSWSFNDVYVRISRLPLTRWFRRLVYFFQPFLFIYMIFKLADLFKNDDFDVLLADDGGYPSAWGCLSSIFAAKRVDIPVRILLVHHEANRPGLFMVWYEYIIDALIIKSVSAIVCPSYATRKALLERRNINAEFVRIRVIYNEIIQTDTNEEYEHASEIKSLINAGKELIIGIVGRIEPYKGHEDVIYAISRMKNKDLAKIKFVIIGKGADLEVERLQRISRRLDVEDNVYFLGYVEGASTSLIKQLDLLVVASRSFEGFGLTLAEAMEVGTPVLATRVGAIQEFLNESVGYLVSPGSPREISLALVDFINNKTEWEKRVKPARAKIRGVSGQMAEEYRKLFIECFDRPSL